MWHRGMAEAVSVHLWMDNVMSGAQNAQKAYSTGGDIQLYTRA